MTYTKAESKPFSLMLTNFLVIALRNLRKHSFYSFINMAGLSIGIAVCLVIVLFILHEFRYDTHHANADRIYRIHSDIRFGGNHWDMVFAPAPMANALVEEFPEVEASVQFRSRGSYLIKREHDNIKEDRVIWTSKDFFKVFTVPVLAGNPEKALEEPNTVAISQRLAEKLFSDENPMGQTLTLDNQWPVKVTAVFEDMPATSHFHFDLLIAIAGLDEAKQPNWLSNNFQTYILFRDGARIDGFDDKLTSLIQQHTIPQAAEVFGEDFTMEKFEASGNHIRYTIQPLTDIHLKSNLLGEFEPNFNIQYIFLFGSIALFILIIACINFMNLSTARSANRAREVGIRKVMGSQRTLLMRQFLFESILLSLFSFVLAIGLAYVLLPIFNVLAGRSIALPFHSLTFYLMLLITALITGILAGIYPAFFLSAFKPVQVLKGNLALGMKSGAVRSTLVVVQFMISIFLVIATLVVYRQLNFIQTKNLGFNKDQVILVDDTYALGTNRVAFKNEIEKDSRIVSGAFSGYLPVAGTWRSDTPWWAEGKDAVQENMVSLQNWRVDVSYIRTLGMQILEGRDFSLEFPSDSSAVILNKAAANAFAFSGPATGSKIVTFEDSDEGTPDMNRLRSLNVIGVVENFHFESLKQNVGPVMLFLSTRPQGYAFFRFHAAHTKEVVDLIERTWKEMAPGQPLTYSFLDDRFGMMYAAETRLGNIFAIFAALAILIASLGLFALTAFTAEQRTKEIGIRKVLGAGTHNIVLLLSKEFTWLILIAFALTIPFAWWFVNSWLEDYQYKVEVGVGLYVLAGLLALFIAWITTGFQSIKAAHADPVKSLRSE